MRSDLPAGAEKLTNAGCGCERYAIPTADADGKRLVGTVALHTCSAPPKAARRKP